MLTAKHSIPKVSVMLEETKKHAPKVYALAERALSTILRRRREWGVEEPPEILLSEAVSEVWLIRAEHEQVSDAECARVAAARIRQRLRAPTYSPRRREYHEVVHDTPEPAEQLDTQLSQQALLAQVEARMSKDEWALLQLLCTTDLNLRQLAADRCGSTATEREVYLEHGRLRKARMRLLRQARAILDELAVEPCWC